MRNSALQGSSRFLSRSALIVALGSFGGAALAGGCASELNEPDAYPQAMAGGGGGGGTPAQGTGGSVSSTGGTPPAAGGTAGTTGGTTPAGGAATGGMMGGGVPPLAACVKTLFASNCAAVCHSTMYKDAVGGGLDLSGDAVGERLRNATAQNTMATDKAACGSKLIDADNPAQSVLGKRVAGKGVCGSEMPAGAQLGATDVKCVQDWLNLF
jgi:hypothetical protein